MAFHQGSLTKPLDARSLIQKVHSFAAVVRCRLMVSLKSIPQNIHSFIQKYLWHI